MKIKLLLFLSLATLACWQLILPSVNSLSLPLERTYGIISRVVIAGRSPFTNYAIYFILLLLPSLLFAVFASLQKNSFSKLIYIKLGELGSKALRSNSFLPIFCLLLLSCWLFNTTQPFFTYLFSDFVNDGFHFGEKIGLSLTYLNNPLDFHQKEYLLIHGFGSNVIPGMVGIQLGGYNRDIAFSLIAVYLQGLLAIIFSFLILLEVAAFISQQKKWSIFLFFALCYFSLYGSVFVLGDRDTIFLLQVLLSIRWLRLERHTSKDITFKYNSNIYAGAMGFLIPISVFYVYDRATYSIFLFLCLFAYFSIINGRRFVAKNFVIALSCLSFAWVILILIFGLSFLPVSIKQVLYWAKYSGLFTSLPYPKIKLNFTDIQNWLPIFLQSLYINIILLKFLHSRATKGETFKSFLSDNSVTIFLFICSILYMRVALGRSDSGHILSPGFFSIFSFVTLIIQELMPQQISTKSWIAVILAGTVFSSLFNLQSVTTAINVFGLVQLPTMANLAGKTNAELIKPSYIEAVQEIKDDVAGQSCFYTLTSEGIWYRLLAMKPCSKYWYLIYSTSIDSQRELVKDLQKENPRIILYSNQSLGNGIDGVAKETSHLLVHQYIWEHYRPYKRFKDCWFWIRREADVDRLSLFVPLPNTALGYFDKLSTLESNKNLDVLAQGWTFVPQQQLPNESYENVVFITFNPPDSPQKLTLVGVNSITTERSDVAIALNNANAVRSGWNVNFNKLNLPPDIVNIRAWAYNPKDRKFYELPSSSIETIEGK